MEPEPQRPTRDSCRVTVSLYRPRRTALAHLDAHSIESAGNGASITPIASRMPHGSLADAAAWRAQAELILDAAGEGIYGLDLHGRCTFVNPAAARMTGHSVEELLGNSMHDVVHHSHSNGCAYTREQCPIYAALADGMIRNVVDEVFWRKDGSPFPVEYTSTPIYDDGALVGAVVVFRDITIRRQTEERLRRALSEVQRLKEQLQRENHSLRREVATARTLPDVVGTSPAMQQLCDVVARMATSDSSVLIVGETGTGKELVARAIHRGSARCERPLIQLNCGAMSSNLIDSELFGHEKGAFTGAHSRREGRFERADGGTLFLDEIGELPLEAQSKLLRVLQEQRFERVGGNETLSTNVRVIAATNRDLKGMVKAGTFRADLYFRLSVLGVRVPSLRERLSDIPALVAHFVQRLELRSGRPLGRVDEVGLRRLAGYDWPGNVRELQNVIERAAVMSDRNVIQISESAFEFGLGANSLEPNTGRENVGERAQTLEDVERTHILAALEKTRWRLAGPSGAGAVLGLHPNTLRHRMKKLGLTR